MVSKLLLVVRAGGGDDDLLRRTGVFHSAGNAALRCLAQRRTIEQDMQSVSGCPVRQEALSGENGLRFPEIMVLLR